MTYTDSYGELEVMVRATIRTCREEDLPALEWMGLFSPHRRIIREAFEAQERGEGLMVLAVAAGFPIAQVWMRFGRRDGTPTATLWALRTFYPLQRAGIGRRMMQTAERILACRGIARAELEVESADPKLLDFYYRLGWRPVEAPGGQASAEPDGGPLLLTRDIAVG